MERFSRKFHRRASTMESSQSSGSLKIGAIVDVSLLTMRNCSKHLFCEQLGIATFVLNKGLIQNVIFLKKPG